jgi:hypothetical protein
MKTTKRLAAALSGVSAFALVATAAAPAIVSAQSEQAPQTEKKGQAKANRKIVKLQQSSNEAVNLDTELDCNTHTLSARVTNKTDAKITPSVTFNEQEPTLPSTFPIEPGKTATYFYNFSGNNMRYDIKVSVDTFSDVKASPTVNCSEPISFKAQQTSGSAITGYLSNNSSLVAQTVLLRVGSGDIRTEMLEPGESRLVALPFTSYEGQQSAYLTVGNTSGFESTYAVELNSGGVVVPLPKEM